MLNSEVNKDIDIKTINIVNTKHILTNNNFQSISS